ncbi:MAG: hypothetical protein ACPGYT_06865 [Nitrospirales bacterium]
MRNQFLFSFIVATLLSFLWLAPGTAHADTTITLDKAVHVITTEGSDIVLKEGMYDLEPTEEWLRITPSGGTAVDALLVEAQVGNHEESVKAPMALSDTGETPDSHHIVLILPNGQKYETVGTYSGLRSRGRSFPLSRKRLKTLMAAQREARRTEFVSPMYGGSGGKRSFNLDCGSRGVIVGILGKAGTWVDALGVICQRINSNGQLGTEFTSKTVGGKGGKVKFRRCPEGQVMGSGSARAGSFIEMISMGCFNWDPANKQRRGRAADAVFLGPRKGLFDDSTFISSNPDARDSRTICPRAKVGKALRGKYGTYIDSLRIVCDEWNR